jgi:RimJ/RimL family protein N-acetyltransferase
MPPTLETPRLRLRPYRVTDFEFYAALFSETPVMRFLGGKPLSREVCWTRLIRHIGMWPAMGFGYFVLECKQTGALVGQAGFQELKRDIAPHIDGTLEAGWAITGARQGEGLAGEAMRAALSWADAERPELRATCIIDPENAPSLRLAAKLGFAAFSRTHYQGNPIVVMELERPPSR